jgi:hypothetical protein
MQNQTVPRPHGVPESFYSKFGSQITAVLSGFDRIRFRATLRMLYQPGMMDRYLAYCGVGLNKFKEFAESTTAKIKAAAYQAAAAAGRPLQYLGNNQLSKEDLARELAHRDKIKEGLIAIFTAVQPCLSYAVRGDYQSKQSKLANPPASAAAEALWARRRCRRCCGLLVRIGVMKSHSESRLGL